MKRPLLGFSIAMIIGIIFSSCFDNIFLISLAVGMGVLLVLYLNKTYLLIPSQTIIIVVFFSIGAFEYFYFNNLYLHRFEAFAEYSSEIRAVIDSQPELSPKTAVYIIDVKEIKMEDKIYELTGKLKLRAMLDEEKSLYNYGDEIYVSGSIEISKGQRNPGGYDYRKYLANCGISGEIFAGEGSIKLGKSNFGNPFALLGYSIRNGIIETINNLLGENQAGLLNGMLVGERAGLNREMRQNFSDAGLTHIMAVSGMNVAFVILPLMFFFKKLKLSKRLSNILAICSLVLFVFITGFSASVLRAVVMASIILLAQILYREADVFSSLAFAAIVLLIASPGTLFDIGFQLSFAATLSLVLFYKRLYEFIGQLPIPKLISETVAVTFAAQILVTPLGVLYFNRFSIVSVFTNLLVVPLCQNITIIGFAMAGIGQLSMPIASIPAMINDFFLSFILAVTKFSSFIPFSAIQLTTPPIVLIIIYYISVLYFGWYCFIKKKSVDFRIIIILVAAILLIFLLPIVKPPEMEVVFLDVGEGDSIYIKTVEGKNVLIDGGGFKKSTPDSPGSGEMTVIPFLLDYGVDKLDLIISTHPHEDHMQGLVPVVKNFDIGVIIEPAGMPEKEYKKLNSNAIEKKIPIEECIFDNKINIDSKTYIKILYPFKTESIDDNVSDVNERSLIFKLIYEKTSILFTADMDGKMEEELTDLGIDVEADVIKVAHHGSRTASTVEFLEKVKPKAAIISVGRNNFGHPSPRVLDRLEASGAKIFRTDENGGIILKSDGESIKIQTTINTNSH